nr:MAG TPA: hypothetical protein [Caudoviricetes sp.]
MHALYELVGLIAIRSSQLSSLLRINPPVSIDSLTASSILTSAASSLLLCCTMQPFRQKNIPQTLLHQFLVLLLNFLLLPSP